MSIATELGKSVKSITESYKLLELAGGTLPAQLNADNLPQTIQDTLFPLETPEWGRVYYYSGWEDTWEDTMGDDSYYTITIDQAKLRAYNENLSYNNNYLDLAYYTEEMAEEAGYGPEYYDKWVYGEGTLTDAPILTDAELISQAGITVVFTQAAFDEQMTMLQLTRKITADKTSSILRADLLSETEYNNLGILSGNISSCSVGGSLVPLNAIRRFEFGSNPTTAPQGFLRGCSNLETISEIPENVTTIQSFFLHNCISLNCDIIMPGVTTISTSFLCGCTAFDGYIDTANKTLPDAYWFLRRCTSLTSLTIEEGFNVNATQVNSFLTELTNLQSLTVKSSWVPSGDATLTVSDNTSPAYVNGVTITGPYRSQWLALGNRTTSPYRKLIDGGE